MENLTCELPATYEGATALETTLKNFLLMIQPQISPQAAYDIWLAVHETFINIVDHAYEQNRGVVGLTAVWQAEESLVEIQLKDNGRSFALEHIDCPDPALLQEGGYGLYLVSRLVDDVHYAAESEGNVWKLVKFLGA